MSDDDINIAPDAVKSSGQWLNELASEAKATAATYFTSQTTAAQANPGFGSGPELVSYANTLYTQMKAAIDDLATNGQKIVAAAQNVQSADTSSAEGFNREVAALTGLSKPPNPGR